MLLVILGRRGCGKTTQIKTRLPQITRGIIYDPLMEYTAYGETVMDSESLVQTVERQANGLFRVCFVPTQENQSDAFNIAVRLCNWLGDVTLVADEIDNVSSANFIPEPLRWLASYGRHRKVSAIVACRRAAEMPRLVTSQATEICSFNQSEPRDVQYLKSYVSETFAYEASRLPKYSMVRYVPTNPEEILICESNQIPENIPIEDVPEFEEKDSKVASVSDLGEDSSQSPDESSPSLMINGE